MRVVNACPCGEAHRLADQNWRKLREAERKHGLTAPFGSLHRMWRVPRIYLACHQVTAASVAALAEQYDWPEVTS